VKLERPIFVVGSMRSGSTLLRLILDAHPNISVSEETGFMGALAATKQIPNWQHGRGWYERLGWTEQELDDRLRVFYAELFERRALAHGKQRWGEKTPFHSEHIAQMATVFPDAVFVGIVRHPGAVVHSLVRKFHYGIGDAVAYWDATNKEILRRGLELGGERFAMLRYEDLVSHPEETLRELVVWLGEDWSDDLLRHGEIQAAQGAPRIAAGHTRSRDPINPELAGRWVEALAGPDLAVLADRAGELARFLGYDPARAAVSARLVDGDPAGRVRLLTGSTLARRQRGAEAVSLAASDETVVMPDASPTELAKQLRSAEAALERLRSRRAVRWTNSLRRAQRRVTGIPVELRGAVGQALRGTRGSTPGKRPPRE
jgi:hypothetical protein